ncbi:hypothetical protein ASALC70_02090 [Alcanivorax sp. ALC70]|nr:hypothetical protein ASALC70_02090 [Alcanivorax sp. ALC70]
MKKTILISALLGVSGALMAPAALAQQTNIDRQENIKEEYQKAMEAQREAKEKGMSESGTNPDYSEGRKKLDSEGNISEEYRKAMEAKQEAAEKKMDGAEQKSKDYLKQREKIDSSENIKEEYRKAMGADKD